MSNSSNSSNDRESDNAPSTEDAFDLERDLPLTEEDRAVLRALHRDVALSPAAYERFLAQFGHASPEELRKRPVFRGKPFEL